MGFTLTTMRNHVKKVDDAVVVVTIITDGYENASKEYTGVAVKKLVEELKGEGWTFTYMGANQDSVEVAFNLSIRNSRNFDATSIGTSRVMSKDMRIFKFPKDIEPDPKRRYVEAYAYDPTGSYKAKMIVASGLKDKLLSELQDSKFVLELCYTYGDLADCLKD